ncbi:MAG: hypothetical protein MUO62_12430, partial [Anaerolineales bacterium]|nr:hypothetical protein [Anaerolineales bacterium]
EMRHNGWNSLEGFLLYLKIRYFPIGNSNNVLEYVQGIRVTGNINIGARDVDINWDRTHQSGGEPPEGIKYLKVAECVIGSLLLSCASFEIGEFVPDTHDVKWGWTGVSALIVVFAFQRKNRRIFLILLYVKNRMSPDQCGIG